MTVTELKRTLTALSSYASVREKASGPESLIGVQSKDGVLKLIAATTRGGIVATVGLGDFPDTTFTVASRPLLSVAKALKGKLELSWEVDGQQLRLVSDKGGRIALDSTGELKDSGFAKKPRRPTATAFVSGDQFTQIGKLFKAVQQDIGILTPTMHFFDEKCVLTSVVPVSKSAYASLEVAAKFNDEQSGSGYLEFWESLANLSQDGTIDSGLDGVVARSGVYECFSAPYLVSDYNQRLKKSNPPEPPKPWPTFGWVDTAAMTRATVDRKSLIEAIRGQAPNDELSRVTLQVDTGTINVSAFGAEDGMTLPASTEGRGVRSVQSLYALDILRAFDMSKEVELAWGISPAIRLQGKEYTHWTVLIAPVTMV